MSLFIIQALLHNTQKGWYTQDIVPQIIKDIPEKIKETLASLADLIKSNFKIAICIISAFLLIILLILVIVFFSNRGDTEPERPVTSTQSDSPVTEDFFLPYEPDFVPGILLEKEPLDKWTEEEARPFWTNPMEGNEEAWRKRIESGVNSLLENIP